MLYGANFPGSSKNTPGFLNFPQLGYPILTVRKFDLGLHDLQE